MPPQRGQRKKTSGQKRRQTVLAQERIDRVDIEEAVLKGHKKRGVAGDARPERDHPVAEQGLLRLLRREGRRETEPQDDAALPGALLLGEELVAVALRQVGGEKDFLL